MTTEYSELNTIYFVIDSNDKGDGCIDGNNGGWSEENFHFSANFKIARVFFIKAGSSSSKAKQLLSFHYINSIFL